MGDLNEMAQKARKHAMVFWFIKNKIKANHRRIEARQTDYCEAAACWVSYQFASAKDKFVIGTGNNSVQSYQNMLRNKALDKWEDWNHETV